MPIYAYKCSSCGHAADALQKMADAPLTTCPACQQETYVKQLTAPGFQLKGSGWYVTDFRGGGATTAPATDKSEKADTPKSDTKSEAKSEAKNETKGEAQASPAAVAPPPSAPSSGESST
ncbi:MAG: zinc ribbon domain-containing protein [Betaproteobacteria bacterium]|nr:zinc ribbon domain-containing protein [Betaproteobacteria bacterium]